MTARTQRLREIVQVLQEARARLLESVGPLAQAGLDAAPSPGRWSIGEILHHLQLVEFSVARLIGRLLERATPGGVRADPDTDSVLGSLDQFGIEDARSTFVAPAAFTPQAGIGKQVLLDGLAESRAALLDVVENSGASDLGQLSFPHPALGRINGYQWILFIGQHELRHLHQIERSI